MQTKLGKVKDRMCLRYTDQYGPRRTVRVGPLECGMLAGIYAQERDASAQWVVSYGLSLLEKGAQPPYRVSHFEKDTQLPQMISLRLTAHREEILQRITQSKWIETVKGTRQQRVSAAIGASIWACWFDLRCPIPAIATLP